MSAPAGTPTSVTLVAGVDPGTGTHVGQATVTFPTTAAPGFYSLERTYTPDSASSLNYGQTSNSYSMQIVAVSGITTTTSATASSSSFSPDAQVTVTGTVTASSGAPPTGSVYFPTITVTPSNGFTGTVALACAFTSNAVTSPATCSLSPTSVDITTSGALTSTLTINTTGATPAQKQVNKLFWPSTSGAAVAFLLFFLTPRRRPHWPGMLGLLVVFAGLTGVGCGRSGGNGGSVAGSNGGGGGGTGAGNTGTTAGSYTVTVTGTSGSASQMTAVTLTVN
jgi:trimeric autotransporter adhesin